VRSRNLTAAEAQRTERFAFLCVSASAVKKRSKPMLRPLRSPHHLLFASGNLAGIALFLLGTVPLAAQGGPPLRTDEPGTPGNRNWEINVASTQFWSKAEREFESPLLDINYGLGDRIQLKYEVPYLFDSDHGAPFKGGFGNSLL
jgi:hypothetical protein